MPNLAVLYLHNNEVCKKIQHYRKTIITALPNLKYLDDRPVFEDERRYCEAFASGGLEAEREERKKYK
jgi:dynein assembly factor 1